MDKSLQSQIIEYLKDSNGNDDYTDLKKAFISVLQTEEERRNFKKAISQLKKKGWILVSPSSNISALTTKIGGVLVKIKDIKIECILTETWMKSIQPNNTNTTITKIKIKDSIIGNKDVDLRDFKPKIIEQNSPPPKNEKPQKRECFVNCVMN